MNFRRQQSLQADIHHKRQKLSLLTQSITNFKTQNSKQEFEIWKLEDLVADLKKELAQEQLNIDHLRGFERDSFASLRSKFELQKKEISTAIDHGLLSLKETLADEIHQSMGEARKKAAQEQQALEEQIQEAKETLQKRKSELNRTLISLKEDHHRKVLRLGEDSKNSSQNVDSAIYETEAKVAELSKKSEALEQEISLKNNELKSFRNQLLQSEISLKERQTKVDNLENESKSSDQKQVDVDTATASQEAEIESLQQKTSHMQSAFPHLESQRRLLHEELQNLKGNIRVFCRIRPAENLPTSDISVADTFSSRGKQELTLKAAVSGISSRISTHQFHFDKIFQNSPNSEIFLEISQLVQSSLDGQNVCVFAYGQTGSGKTFTMSHGDDGMIPLSVEKIFDDIAALSSQGWRYTVHGRFIEIYNEQILDLMPGSSATAKYEIKHDEVARKTSVTNSKTVLLHSKKHCQEVLEAATKKRSTASTMANSRSSRSHFIFTLEISGVHESGKSCNGTLNLVDLAGSERLATSQAKGDRLKETQAINKSLACLGDVIMSLNKPNFHSKSHVPYRNSKLTYYLKHSLGGNSKTLMFVNISPLAQNTNETLNSLRFAAKVNETKLASPESRSPTKRDSEARRDY